MADPLVQEQTPSEYFRELIESALERQRVRADELTSYYLVNLLCGFMQLDGSTRTLDEPLAYRLFQALDSGGTAQRARLRTLGDISLFVSGFFSDSLRRSLVDVDYYKSMGEYAYGSLSRVEEGKVSPVFAELARKFVAFADVLTDVSERTSLTTNTDLLRIYEKWLRTGSRRNEQQLVERGIVPNTSIGSRFVQ